MSTPLLSLVIVDSDQPEAGDPARLAASRCPACTRSEFPPRDTCPVCAATLEDEELGPHAVLGAYTAVLHPPPGALVDPPYVVGAARFEGGISVLGRIIGRTFDDLEPDLPLAVVVAPFGDQLGYAFRVVEV